MRDFLREAEVAARLKHAGVAHVYEAGMHAGVPYFAMEYVDGEPIDDYVARRGLDGPAILELFLDVLAGIRHAPARGVIHRDLKPSHLLIA